MQIASTNVKTIEIPGIREQLLLSIRQFRLNVFPVVEKGSNKLVGIVGRADILRNPSETQIALLMAKMGTFPVIKKEDTIKLVIEQMLKSRRSKLPIMDDNKETLIGIISISDIIWKLVPESGLLKKVNEYCSDKITVVYENTPANVCAKVLFYSGQEALPVINDECVLVGIVSNNDFLKFADILNFSEQSTIAESDDYSDANTGTSTLIIADKILTIPKKPVKEIMTPKNNLKTVYIASLISEAAKKLRNNTIDQLPVVDEDGNLLSLLTNWDILRAYYDYITTK